MLRKVGVLDSLIRRISDSRGRGWASNPVAPNQVVGITLGAEEMFICINQWEFS